MSPDWPDLPSDLVATIARLLTTITDYLAFRGVCKSWRSAATVANFDTSNQLPWLMFMSIDETLVYDSIARKNTVHFCDMTIKLLDFFNNRIIIRTMYSFPRNDLRTKFFSCSGWLLGIREETIELELVHVARGTRMRLPGLDTFPGFHKWYMYDRHDYSDFIDLEKFHMMISCRPRCFIKKMALLRIQGPIDDDFVVVVIWGEKNQLGFASPAGDLSWKVLDSWDEPFNDVICHNGIVYALDLSLRIVSYDILRGTAMQLVFTYPSLGMKHYRSYLVANSSNGRFIIVIPAVEYDGVEDMEADEQDFLEGKSIANFRMFECDLKVGSGCKEIADIGDKVMFLGFNSSLCLDVPPDAESKPKTGAIYFTDWNVYGHLYSIVYHFYETQTGIYTRGARREECMPFRSAGVGYVVPLLWVLPSLS